jgi:cytochrome c biogenesis protein CcdA
MMLAVGSDTSIFFGGSIAAATIAGMIALFAPCCVSVMLPTYFAASFQNRRLLIAMTFLFAAGIATVIVPIALGASLVRRVLLDGHSIIYSIGGVTLLLLAAFTLTGGQIRLPSPGGRSTGRGPVGVYALGLFSGVASSCCAPVLIGVIALSGVTDSFLQALGLGLAYVFGMVAPLLIISLLWDHFDWKSSPLFRRRSVTWRLGRFTRTISGTALASGILLALMGGWALAVSTQGGMQSSSQGWQGRLLLWLQRQGRSASDILDNFPGWSIAVGLITIVALLARLAARQIGWLESSPQSEQPIDTKQTDREYQK